MTTNAKNSNVSVLIVLVHWYAGRLFDADRPSASGCTLLPPVL